MRSFRFIAALVMVPAAFAQQAAVRLWAVSDGVRVSPVTGNLLESKPFVHSDYPSGNPRKGNLVWDAAGKTVTLKAARNEFTAFQLVIEAAEPQNQVDVKLAALVQENGAARLERPNIAIFKEWYTQVRRPTTGYERTSLGPDWYADALMLYRSGAGSGVSPSRSPTCTTTSPTRPTTPSGSMSSFPSSVTPRLQAVTRARSRLPGKAAMTASAWFWTFGISHCLRRTIFPEIFGTAR